MFESFTAGSLRALSRAENRARDRQSPTVELLDLAAGLADEPESRAAALAAEFGLAPEAMLGALGCSPTSPTSESASSGEDWPRLPFSPDTRGVLVAASSQAKGVRRGSSVGTEHLLGALLASADPVATALADAGLEVANLLATLAKADTEAAIPIPLAGDISPLEITDPRRRG